MEIKKPIFIVGSGRSGTTILYNLLAGHKTLGWFSNYTNLYPNKPELARLNNLYKNVTISKKYRENKYFPQPSEGHNIWDLFHPINGGIDRGSSPPFNESDVKNADIRQMKYNIGKHLKVSNSVRFLNKNTRNTRRIPYLYSIFPDSYFIHIIRDGRAAVNSLMNIDWWKRLEPWFVEEPGKTVLELIEEDKNEVILAARCWKFEVMKALEDSKTVPKNHYLEIRYEDLTENPMDVLVEILDFTQICFDPGFKKHFESFSLKNMNYKYTENLTENQIDLIESEAKELLHRLKYI